MKLFLVYLGIGILTYCALLAWFRKSGLDGKRLNTLWLSWLMSGEPLALLFGPLLWPILAILTVLEYWHLKAKRAEAEGKAAAGNCTNKYSNMSMDELLAAQKKALSESKSSQSKENHAA